METLSHAIRSAYMMPEIEQEPQIAGEAIETYMYQYVYTAEAIKLLTEVFKAQTNT